MVLCYESRRLARSLGPGSSVGKKGEIGKMLASGKQNFARRFFSFSRAPIFFSFFSQCGAWSEAILRVAVNKYVCVSLHTDRLVLK